MNALFNKYAQQVDEGKSKMVDGAKLFMEGYHEVGSALLGIKNSGCWKGEYDSLEAVYTERFGFNRNHASRLMRGVIAYENLQNVPHGVLLLPDNERQIRPLATKEFNAKPEFQIRVWTVACKWAKWQTEDGRPTGKLVEKVIAFLRNADRHQEFYLKEEARKEKTRKWVDEERARRESLSEEERQKEDASWEEEMREEDEWYRNHCHEKKEKEKEEPGADTDEDINSKREAFQGWSRESLIDLLVAYEISWDEIVRLLGGTDMSATVTQRAVDIIKRGFRAEAFKAHPDRGGSHDDMVNLTTAKDCLDAWIAIVSIKKPEPKKRKVKKAKASTKTKKSEEYDNVVVLYGT